MCSQVQILLKNSHVLVHIGVMILLGYAAGWAAKKVSLPRISGYIVAGMLLSLSGLVGKELILERLSLITDLALGIIAFSIGGALKVRNLRRLEGSIIWITLIQGVAVLLLVSAAVLLFLPLAWPGVPPPFEKIVSLALLVGAVCVATAPAAVMGVVHEYHAKGPVTTVLLGVITIDDALTIFLFSIATGVTQSLAGGGGSFFYSAFWDPAREIAVSLFLGCSAGLFLRGILHVCKRTCGLLGIALGAIFLVSGLALTLDVSPLLACMALGFTLVNLIQQPERWFEAVENIEEPIFALFFVIAGAHLDLEALFTAGGLGLVLLVSRAAGKFGGTFLGAKITGASPEVKKYLPLGLLPQAGVAIGLVLAAQSVLPDPGVSGVMVNAVLVSVLMNELISPPLVLLGLSKAGETRDEQER